MNFEKKLHIVAASINGGYAFMGSKWKNYEAEYMAAQTIKACELNLRQHGEAFSWQGKNTLSAGGNGLVNNKQGVNILIADGDFLLEPYNGQVCAPEGIVLSEDGRPMVFRCTDKVLDYAMQFLGSLTF